MKNVKAFFAVCLVLLAINAQGQLLEVVKIDSVYIAQLEKLNTLLVSSAKLDSTNFANKLDATFAALATANAKILTVTKERDTKEEQATVCAGELATAKAELYKYKPRTLAGRILRKARDGLAVVGGITLFAVVPLLIPR